MKFEGNIIGRKCTRYKIWGITKIPAYRLFDIKTQSDNKPLNHRTI